MVMLYSELQKVFEKYYAISGESNVAEDQSGRATYIVFLEISTLISQLAPASLVIIALLKVFIPMSQIATGFTWWQKRLRACLQNP